MSEHPVEGNPGPMSFCGQCGGQSAGDHDRCRQRAEWDPPRYCGQCGRRMVVQVDPLGWRARCSRHGELKG